MIDPTLLNKLMSENIEGKIGEAFRETGDAIPNISLFTSFISELYMHHPPEKVNGKFACVLTNKEIDLTTGKVVHRTDIFNDDFSQEVCIVLINDGNCLIVDWDKLKLDDVGDLTYKFENKVESIYANGKSIPIINPESSSYSIFAQPTFKDLDEALKRYYNNRAKYSICSEINGCWINQDRVRFLPKPEHSMRDSLWKFLRDVLRGNPEVKREQNVDDTDPVDIKITWKSSSSRALIEIKWLGKSFNPNDQRITQNYTQQRAIDGAEQLRNYLRVSREEDLDYYFEGYLVIFDARRRGIGNDYNKVIDQNQALFYRDKDIIYPDHLISDPTIKLEYRFFLEPNVS